uniref:Ig-like domain-containing protein n=1 Tax=Sphaeramia orbicularis TaxID=375764 RepID=A0A672ZCC5_9TELE
ILTLASLPLKSDCRILTFIFVFSATSQIIGPSHLVVALLGADVVLPCHLEPADDLTSKSLEWGRLDLEPRFVHVRHSGQDLQNQNLGFKGRTSLSTEKLKRGDLSLTLSDVKLSDNGTYRCYMVSEDMESNVQLLVGAASSPFITGIDRSGGSVVLECTSSGWYPEPEVSWMDSEGHLVSAGPPETVRGPDDLYTVSSRVTVDKRHGSTVTCRVHQDRTNQTRLTQIRVSGRNHNRTEQTWGSFLVTLTEL